MANDSQPKRVVGDVIVLATLDTKGREAAYVRDLLTGYGVPTRLADAGTLAPPAVKPDIGREEILAAAAAEPAALAAAGDRGAAVSAACGRVPRLGRRQPFTRAALRACWRSADRPAPRSAPRPCAPCRWASPS